MSHLTRTKARFLELHVDKATAKSLGRKFYHGKYCTRHPEIQGERYVSCGACRLCVRNYARSPEMQTVFKPARGAAKAAGHRFYHGKVCSKHPELGGERYTSNGVCSLCAREHSMAQGEARKSKLDER